MYYTAAGNFIFHMKTENVYADIAGDVKERFDFSNSEAKITLPMEKK